jgi:GR25 family glycosyltransferase involved in LPS biosynthesis
MIERLEDIVHSVYINLESRPDRKQHIEQQLAGIGLTNTIRFNAVRLPNGNGRVGCSMSHLKCLEIAQKSNYSHLLIIEDDTLFLKPALFKKHLQQFLTSETPWDVILFAGNNMPPYRSVANGAAVQVSHCQTTTCYLVNAHYFGTLIANIKEGIAKLLKDPSNHFHYAIDKYWLSLQKRDRWFLITPPSVIQREDYSDIEQRKTNYAHLMVDLDKEQMIKQMQAQNALLQMAKMNIKS